MGNHKEVARFRDNFRKQGKLLWNEKVEKEGLIFLLIIDLIDLVRAYNRSFHNKWTYFIVRIFRIQGKKKRNYYATKNAL